MAKLPHPSSLWKRLLWGFVGTLVGVGLISGEVFRRYETAKVLGDAYRESSKLVGVLSASIVDPIIAEDGAILLGAIEQVAAMAPRIEEIKIANESGRVLAQWPQDAQHAHSEHLVIDEDILFEGEKFGTIHVTWNMTSTHREIWRHVAQLYLTSAITLVVLTLIIGFLVRRWVVRPVNKINERLVSLSLGDLDTPLNVDAAIEFERLAASVNALTKSLRVQHAREADLRRAAQVIDNASEGVMITDPEGIIQSVNPAATKITGYEPEEIVGHTPSILKSGRQDSAFYTELWTSIRNDGMWQGELWNRRKNGDVYPQWLNISSIKDEHGDVTHYVGIFNDTTVQHESRERLRKLAYEDSLSGLPNRQFFNEQLDSALVHAQRVGSSLAIMYMDLDHFKEINDTLGHTYGDRLLRLVAERLRGCLRAFDSLARLGGDEFTIILRDLDRSEHVINVAEKLLGAFAEPFELEGRECYLTASVGISVFPDDGQDRDTLLKHADVAMYEAKKLGRNIYRVYGSHMNDRSLERMELENDLRKAVENCELQVVFQPQVDTLSGQLVGAEALCRWYHTDHGWISPATFIPMAEAIGLIGRIGAWVLDAACRQAGQWAQRGLGPVRVAVNISGRQIRDQGLLQVVQDTLDETGVEPDWLKLELTESVLMENRDLAISTFESIREMGVHLSIDDFGTGYSSLNYLKQFSIQELKIDRSFIKGVPNDSDDEAIAGAIIAMAHALGLTVTAEGVETEEQLAFLRKHGCDRIQGYLFGAPMFADEFTRLLETKTRLASSE